MHELIGHRFWESTSCSGPGQSTAPPHGAWEQGRRRSRLKIIRGIARSSYGVGPAA